MSRLFYPTLFTVTAALTALLWARHGLPIQWLTLLGTAVAQAQSPVRQDAQSPVRQDDRPPRYESGKRGQASTQRLPPTDPPAASPRSATSSPSAGRTRQGPLTQLQIETPGGPGAMEVTRPVPIPSAKVVARVGNEVVLAADVMPIVQSQFLTLARSRPPEEHERLLQILTHQVIAQTVQGKLIVAAMKEEIPKDKWAEVEKDILKKFDIYERPELLKECQAKNDAELDKKLKERGSSLKRQKEAFVDKALAGEWMRKQIKFDQHISHEEMLRYYDEHLREYEFKAKVRFEEIRINYGEQRNKRAAWDTIQRLARQVYAGASLAEIAKAHSDAASSTGGGLNDWTKQGSIKCEPLDQALFHLPIGVLSQVIDDGRGYVVVRVVERKEAGTTSFQEAQGGILKNIRTEREKKARDKTLLEFLQKHQSRAWTIYDEQPVNARRPEKKMTR